MNENFKPGDVAMCDQYGVALVVAFSRLGCNSAHEGYPIHVHFGDGDWGTTNDLRRLVVIDAEDREQVERLWREQQRGIESIREANPGQVGVSLVDALQVGLRRMSDPEYAPKPDEPLGLGAVVEAACGKLYVLAGDGWLPSTVLGVFRNPRKWDDIAVVRILSPGVKWDDIAFVRILSPGVLLS